MNGSMSNLLSGFCTSYVYIPLAAFLGALTAYTILQQKVNTKSINDTGHIQKAATNEVDLNEKDNNKTDSIPDEKEGEIDENNLSADEICSGKFPTKSQVKPSKPKRKIKKSEVKKSLILSNKKKTSNKVKKEATMGPIPDKCPFASSSQMNEKMCPVDLGDQTLINDLEKFYAEKLETKPEESDAEESVLEPANVADVALMILKNSNSLDEKKQDILMKPEEKETENTTKIEQLKNIFSLLEKHEVEFQNFDKDPLKPFHEDEEEYRFRVLQEDGEYAEMDIEKTFDYQRRLYGI